MLRISIEANCDIVLVPVIVITCLEFEIVIVSLESIAFT